MLRRRKSIITLLFILSFFLYVNWFISISSWSSDGNSKHWRDNSQNRLEIDIINAAFDKGGLRALRKGQQSQQILFELFEAYEVNEKIEVSNSERLSDKKSSDKHAASDPSAQDDKNSNQFLLISTRDLSDQNQVQVILPVKSANSVSKLDRQELTFLFKLLFRNRAFVADVRLHNEVRFKDSTLSLASQLESSTHADDALGYEILTMKSISGYLDKENQNNVLVTFGIHYNNVESLNHVKANLINKKKQTKINQSFKLWLFFCLFSRI
jgi:hypothetical protein